MIATELKHVGIIGGGGGVESPFDLFRRGGRAQGETRDIAVHRHGRIKKNKSCE